MTRVSARPCDLHLYVLAGAIYFAIAFPLSLATRRVSARMSRGVRQID